MAVAVKTLRRLIGGLIYVVAVQGASEAQSGTPRPIYRCAGAAGEVMFTDLPCPGGRMQPIHTVSAVHLAVSNPAERATLERLERESAVLGRVERSRASKAAAARSRALLQSERRCAAARAGLDRVHATKRRGYRASSAAALAARERGYRAQRDQNCAG